MTRTPKISIPLPMIWMKWSIDGSKLLTAFSIFAPPTAAGAQPIITIGSGNCSGARPGLLAVAAVARDNGQLCPVWHQADMPEHQSNVRFRGQKQTSNAQIEFFRL